MDSIFDAALAYEYHTFRSPDHLEAVQAIVERRRPHFEERLERRIPSILEG